MKILLLIIISALFSSSAWSYDGYNGYDGYESSSGYNDYHSDSGRPFISGFPRKGQSLNSHIAERNARTKDRLHRERVEQHIFEHQMNNIRTYNPATGGFD